MTRIYFLGRNDFPFHPLRGAMQAWCVDNAGFYQWESGTEYTEDEDFYDRPYFDFKDENVAVMFCLKFSDYIKQKDDFGKRKY